MGEWLVFFISKCSTITASIAPVSDTGVEDPTRHQRLSEYFLKSLLFRQPRQQGQCQTLLRNWLPTRAVLLSANDHRLRLGRHDRYRSSRPWGWSATRADFDDRRRMTIRLKDPTGRADFLASRSARDDPENLRVRGPSESRSRGSVCHQSRFRRSETDDDSTEGSDRPCRFPK